MSRRGEITVECDVNGCHAEQVFPADALLTSSVDGAKWRAGWRSWGGKDICPQCAEEGKADAPQR